MIIGWVNRSGCSWMLTLHHYSKSCNRQWEFSALPTEPIKLYLSSTRLLDRLSQLLCSCLAMWLFDWITMQLVAWGRSHIMGDYEKGHNFGFCCSSYYKSNLPTTSCDSDCKKSLICGLRSGRSYDPALCQWSTASNALNDEAESEEAYAKFLSWQRANSLCWSSQLYWMICMRACQGFRLLDGNREKHLLKLWFVVFSTRVSRPVYIFILCMFLMLYFICISCIVCILHRNAPKLANVNELNTIHTIEWINWPNFFCTIPWCTVIILKITGFHLNYPLHFVIHSAVLWFGYS